MKIKRWRNWIVMWSAIFAICAAFGIFGCDSDSSTDTSDSSEKVAFIGELKGTLADEIEQLFINPVPYDGTATNLPILLSPHSLPTLSLTQWKGIQETYANHKPIVLVHATETEINTLLGLLGLDQNYILPENLPEGKQYAEFFAVDKEEGHSHTCSMYPPPERLQSSDDPDAPEPEIHLDTPHYQSRRADIFYDWFAKDGSRVTEKVKARKQEAAAAIVSLAESEKKELKTIAEGHNTTVVFPSAVGNVYNISYTVYSFHEFDPVGEDAEYYDWFWVIQEGSLQADEGYKTDFNWQDYTAEVGPYVGLYYMRTWMPEVQEREVILKDSSPHNANRVKQHTSGVSMSLGTSVGTGSAGLNFGVSITNQTTIDIPECEVVNNSNQAGKGGALWTYTFERWKGEIGEDGGYKGPPMNSRTLFQPKNQWIWKFHPSVRNDHTHFSSALFVELIRSKLGGLWTSPLHVPILELPFLNKVPLVYPPLIAAKKELHKNKDRHSILMQLRASQAWKASISLLVPDTEDEWEAPNSAEESWCRFSGKIEITGESDKKIEIDIDEYTSDKTTWTKPDRRARLHFETVDSEGNVDGKGEWTTTVYQASTEDVDTIN